MELMEEGLLTITYTPQWLFRITAAATLILIATSGVWLAFHLMRRLITRLSYSVSTEDRSGSDADWAMNVLAAPDHGNNQRYIKQARRILRKQGIDPDRD